MKNKLVLFCFFVIAPMAGMYLGSEDHMEGYKVGYQDHHRLFSFTVKHVNNQLAKVKDKDELEEKLKDFAGSPNAFQRKIAKTLQTALSKQQEFKK